MPRPLLKISFILPVLNEASIIAARLQRLQVYRQRGHEIVVVDGGGDDNTPELAESLADRVERSPIGRSQQMNRGAELASGNLLLFLHVDTSLPDSVDRLLDAAVRAGERQWGWFDVRLSNSNFSYRLIAKAMNLRARITSVCTGDQAMFVTSELFRQVGGFPELPLMEDVAMSKLLRRQARPVCIHNFAVTSSRRWENKGLFNTIVLMWQLRLLYFLGVSPTRLVKRYYPNSEN